MTEYLENFYRNTADPFSPKPHIEQIEVLRDENNPLGYPEIIRVALIDLHQKVLKNFFGLDENGREIG